MQTVETVYVFIIAILIVILMKYFSPSKSENFEESAADACRTVSSEADKIMAHWDGVAKVAGQINPIALITKAIKGGDNNVDTETRNIIEENLSAETRLKITNECNNASASTQSNVIDNTQCEYCQKFGCDLMNVIQENSSETEQKCVLNSAVTSLMKQADSIKAQALAEAIQRSQGLASGNNSTSTRNCNVIKKDLSQKQYIDTMNKCTNQFASDQSNLLKNCGNVTNVVQRNIIKKIQQCVNSTTTDSTADQSSGTDIENSLKTDQTSTGIDPTAASIISIVSFCSCSIVLVIILVLASQNKQEIKEMVANSK